MPVLALPIVTTQYVTLTDEQEETIFSEKLGILARSSLGEWISRGEVVTEGDPHPHTGVGHDEIVKFKTKKEKEERMQEIREHTEIKETAHKLQQLLIARQARERRNNSARKAVAP